MKIFNWVNKRLHPKVLNDSLESIDVHKIEPAISETDTQALLKQVAVVDVIGGWGNGILAIGTFGFDTLKPFHHQQKYLTLERDTEGYQTDEDGGDDEDRHDVEHEELNPLMYAALDDDFNGIAEPKKPEDLISATGELPSNEVSDLKTVEGSDNQKKGERITLADLFLADSDEMNVNSKDQTKTMSNASKELSFKKKRGLSFAKKIIPQVTDESRPLKNIQQLMRRMLKRKIYPDFEVKNVKADGQKGSNKAGCSVVKHKRETSDSIFLLPCQGSNV